jgi:hypothetical protein
MGESRPPLRAAFWAISAALLLMLLATLSDPYRVRQSLLARRAPEHSRSGTQIDAPNADQRPHSEAVPSPAGDHTGSFESLFVAEDAAGLASPTDTATPDAPVTSGAQMHVVSAGDNGERRHIARPVERPAMPILSPGELSGPTAGGRFEELPPPPEFDTASDLMADGYAVEGAADLSLEAERALERLRLETELLTLRHDLNRSIDSRQIEQIQHLQQQQSTLLERQQQTAERLEQLADHLAAQSTRLDRLFEERAQVAPSPTTGGRHRLSFVIESDDVAGILERLGRWSSDAALEHAAPPVTRSAFVDPQPRYLAPPPHHSDPTPLTDLERPTDESVPPRLAIPAPVTGGPLFAPPAICH